MLSPFSFSFYYVINFTTKNYLQDLTCITRSYSQSGLSLGCDHTLFTNA